MSLQSLKIHLASWIRNFCKNNGGKWLKNIQDELGEGNISKEEKRSASFNALSFPCLYLAQLIMQKLICRL